MIFTTRYASDMLQRGDAHRLSLDAIFDLAWAPVVPGQEARAKHAVLRGAHGIYWSQPRTRTVPAGRNKSAECAATRNIHDRVAQPLDAVERIHRWPRRQSTLALGIGAGRVHGALRREQECMTESSGRSLDRYTVREGRHKVALPIQLHSIAEPRPALCAASGGRHAALSICIAAIHIHVSLYREEYSVVRHARRKDALHTHIAD